MWQFDMAANLVVALAYVAIAGAVLVPLVREGQLRSNRLGAATAAIFLTSAVHHGNHAAHMTLPVFGMETTEGLALRTAFSGWHTVIGDIVAAWVGIYYWTMRRTYGSLMRGAKLFEDMKERQRQALEINDNIVQGLFVAQTALALDEREMSEEAMRTTLDSARQIISDLLGKAGSEFEVGPRQLLREKPATVADRQMAGQ